MLRLGVVGGRLQGTEAAYLGAAAGYEVVLIDKHPETPASGLAHESHVFDVVTDPLLTRRVLGSCDAVIPACENEATLRALVETMADLGIPLAFHMPSYELTSSKIVSDGLFAELDVPRPVPWPHCGFPVVVKPSGASGSVGVRLAADHHALHEARVELEGAGHEVVVQQYVEGPSLSLEVIRSADGRTVPLLATTLDFDADFDCKRVTAPIEHSNSLADTLDAVSCRLAEHIGLVGLMDVEVMVDGRVPRVIEIDARLPSQTPTAVFHSSGLNLVQALIELFTAGTVPDRPSEGLRGVCYQHVRAVHGALQVLGEHVMAEARPLRLFRDESGCDELITDRVLGASSWSATLICLGVDAAEARAKADEAAERLALDSGLEFLAETGPPIAGRVS